MGFSAFYPAGPAPLLVPSHLLSVFFAYVIRHMVKGWKSQCMQLVRVEDTVYSLVELAAHLAEHREPFKQAASLLGPCGEPLSPHFVQRIQRGNIKMKALSKWLGTKCRPWRGFTDAFVFFCCRLEER